MNFFSSKKVRVCLTVILKNISNIFNNLKFLPFKYKKYY